MSSLITDLAIHLATDFATFLTIETGIVSQVKDVKNWIDKRKLQNLSANVDYERIAKDLENYAQAADEYIAERHCSCKRVLDAEDYAYFRETFYASHPNYISEKELISPYLNSYLDQLNELLTGMMTAGEKFLNKRAADILKTVRGVRGSAGEIQADMKEVRKDVAEIRATVLGAPKNLDEIFTLIDPSFIEEYKSENYERCRFEYFNVKRSADSILKAMINGVLVSTDEYEEICIQIYDAIKSSPALFLMSDSSTGKSTLLCKTAVKFAEEGYKVYFTDRSVDVKDFGRIEEETLFFLDNASNNSNLLDKLYALYKKNRYIHVILCDRTHRINTLIDKLDIPEWIIEGKSIVFKNSQKVAYRLPLHKKNISEIILSTDMRKKMSDETIASTVAYEELDVELAETVRNHLVYHERSVADIVLDFCVAYNTAADENIRPSKGHLFDWNIWDEIPEIKGKFKYLAALNLYGVNVTVRQMERITGAGIYELVSEGKLQVIHFVDDVIKLRHDTVADNYFKINLIKPVDVIKELLEERLLTEDTIIKFEREAFSLSNIYMPSEEVKSLRIPELVYKFNRIEEYRKILAEHQRIHSLEFAVISVNACGAKDKEKYCREQIGRSFMEVDPFYKNKIMLWIKYFFFAVYHADTIPEQMFTPLQTIPGLYKKVTKAVDNYIRKNYRNFSKTDREKWLICLEQLFKWIIENINNDDVPSRILLLWVYQHSGRIEQAKDMVYELSNLKESIARTSEFSVAFIRTYESEVQQLVKMNRNDPRIIETNGFIRRYYKGLIDYTNKNSEEYITVIRSFVRFQKNTHHYDEAYHLAKETIEYMVQNNSQFPFYRLYTELGMICQYRKSRNRYYNLDEAINWFNKAIQEIERSDRELLYALKPLCKSYLAAGRYEECLAVCKEIKNLDFKDSEVKSLRYEAIRLQRVKDLNLPVLGPYKWEEKPEPEEIEAEFKKLTSQMTEEQQAFAHAFGLMQHQPKFADYRAAFSIHHNIYIPLLVLSKLDMADTTMVDELIRAKQEVFFSSTYQINGI